MQEDRSHLWTNRSTNIKAGTKMLWWLATADEKLLKDCTTDRNRFRIIGYLLLCTFIFACLSWTYFFYTASESLVVAIPAGMLMGFIILCIDRALINSLYGQLRKNYLTISIRAVLAITIGSFMAQPALLYLFDKEIRVQLAFDNEKKKQQFQDTVANRLNLRKSELLAQQKGLAAEQDNRFIIVENARKTYIAETDGSGGSGKIGLKDIAMAKKEEYLRLYNDYQSLLKKNQLLFDKTREQLNEIDAILKRDAANFEGVLKAGFLARIESLQRLIDEHPVLRWRYILILVILITIELMPLIAKMILPTRLYEQKLKWQDEMEWQLQHDAYEKERRLRQSWINKAFEWNDAKQESFFVNEEKHEPVKADQKNGDTAADRWRIFKNLTRLPAEP